MQGLWPRSVKIVTPLELILVFVPCAGLDPILGPVQTGDFGMEKFLLGLDVWVWRYRERTTHYPGLHFTARPAACDALVRCIDLLVHEGDGARRSVPLRELDPADEAKVSGGTRFKSFSRLLLQYHDASDEMYQLSVGVDGGRSVVEFTQRTASALRAGFEDVKKGVGDYSLSPLIEAGPLGVKDRESFPFWFWPCFGHTEPV